MNKQGILMKGKITSIAVIISILLLLSGCKASPELQSEYFNAQTFTPQNACRNDCAFWNLTYLRYTAEGAVQRCWCNDGQKPVEVPYTAGKK